MSCVTSTHRPRSELVRDSPARTLGKSGAPVTAFFGTCTSMSLSPICVDGVAELDLANIYLQKSSKPRENTSDCSVFVTWESTTKQRRGCFCSRHARRAATEDSVNRRARGCLRPDTKFNDRSTTRGMPPPSFVVSACPLAFCASPRLRTSVARLSAATVVFSSSATPSGHSGRCSA